MNNRVSVLVLFSSLTFVMLVAPGCEKFHDNFPFGPPSTVEPPPSPSDPLPAELIGTWISRSATVDGHEVDLAWVFRDDYFHPNAGSLRLQFTWDGEFSYELLDTAGTMIFQLEGQTVLHGKRLTCKETAKGSSIIDDTLSLSQNKLVLPYAVDQGDAGVEALVTYTK